MLDYDLEDKLEVLYVDLLGVEEFASGEEAGCNDKHLHVFLGVELLGGSELFVELVELVGFEGLVDLGLVDVGEEVVEELDGVEAVLVVGDLDVLLGEEEEDLVRGDGLCELRVKDQGAQGSE